MLGIFPADSVYMNEFNRAPTALTPITAWVLLSQYYYCGAASPLQNMSPPPPPTLGYDKRLVYHYPHVVPLFCTQSLWVPLVTLCICWRSTHLTRLSLVLFSRRECYWHSSLAVAPCRLLPYCRKHLTTLCGCLDRGCPKLKRRPIYHEDIP
jgi:hypothetical protein